MPRIARYVVALIFCFTLLGVAVYAFDARGLSSAASAWQAGMYEARILNTRQQGLDIRGEVPEILEDFGPAYEALNMEIEQAIDTLAEGTRRIRARSVSFDYEIYYTNEVVSIVISATARAVTDRTSVLSINFNPRTGNLVTLTQAMGGLDITPLAEGKIADMIRLDPATYYAAFTAPPTGQAFYLTDTLLVLLFDEFQLSSIPGATSSIRFVRDNIMQVTISRDDYRISPDRYAIRMMPVRRTLIGLGYEVGPWCPINRETPISLHGREIIVLREGENNYQLNGVLQRTLEAPPTLFNGHLYVPISFFDQILRLTAFTINAQDSISFISYLAPPASRNESVGAAPVPPPMQPSMR